MNKLRYLIETSIKQITRSYKLTIVIFFCFYLGMILPFYCIANCNFLIKSLDSLKFDGFETSITATWTSLLMDNKEKNLMENSIQNKDVSYRLSTSFIIGELNNTFIPIKGMDNIFLSRDIDISKGRMYKQNKNECIMGKELARAYNYNLNDYIRIKNTKYKIVGINDSDTGMNSIFIPIDKLESIIKSEDEFVEYEIIANYDNEKSMNNNDRNITTWLSQNMSVQNLEVSKSIDDYYSSKNTVKYWIKSRVIIGIGGLVFACINMMMVLMGKIYENKRIYGMKLGLGMSRPTMYASFFIENIIIALFADLLLFVTMPYAFTMLNMENTVIINAFVVSFILLITIMVCAIISGILMCKFRGKNITNIIREE